MAEYDDERPDFDAVFSDRPEDDPPRRRGSGGGDPLGDTEATGEVPRSRMRDDAGDFDFDDDPEPAPRPPRERPPRRRSGSGGSARRPSSRSRGGGSRGGSRGGGSGLFQGGRGRLVAGIAVAVILVIVIALVVKDCRRSQLEDSYTQYVNGVAQLVATSAEQGQQLRTVLNNGPRDRPPALKNKITAIQQDAQALVDQAEDLDPPGSLAMPQRALVATLQYRVNGLRTLAQNLPTWLQGSDQQFASRGIAGSMQRFLASDVLYQDSFEEPAKRALEADDITGLEVPKLQAFLPNPALASPAGAAGLLPALRRSGGGGSGDAQGGGDTGGNLRGTSLESTVAAPSDTRLTPGTEARIPADESLEWRVTVRNGGDFDESDVVVRASFSYAEAPNDVETREVSIPTIASDESVTVTIPGPSAESITFGDTAKLAIEIEAVPQETRIDNNSAEYLVIITL